MRSQTSDMSRRSQRGYVLVTSLLLLVVMTMFAVSMFRSFTLQDKIAGNVREKQRALANAESAQQYAENYLATLTTITPIELACNKLVPVTQPSDVQICNNAMTPATIFNAFWAVGNQYSMAGQTYSGAVGWNSYLDHPGFYIWDAGPSADGSGEIFQIDTWADAAAKTTVAVIESTYLIKPTVRCLSC
jgi:type IV pilus assembly protein PilX